MNATAKAQTLPAEALALLQQARLHMSKAMATLQQAEHRHLTVNDLYGITATAARAATFAKRACTAVQTAPRKPTNA